VTAQPQLSAPRFAVLGLDPGPTECGLCWLRDGVPKNPAVASTRDTLLTVASLPRDTTVVLEKLECYGMPVGAAVFETAYVIGRILQLAEDADDVRCVLMPRREVKLHLCGSARAKDANVRQALLDRFGGDQAIGKKKSPGPLYGVKSHAWSALALAMTFVERQAGQ
jgi:hypothetical protein